MDRRCFLKSLTAAPAVCFGHSSLIWTELALAQQRDGMSQPDPFRPSEAANNPVGEARGIHPGRVAGSAMRTQPVGMEGRGTGGIMPTPTRRP